MKGAVWSRDLGQERSILYRELLNAPFDEKVTAYESLKRKYLGRVRSPSPRLEIRRRIAESLVASAVDQPWYVFARYLRRLQRLGFSTPDRLVLTCYDAARAVKGDTRAKDVAQRLITRAWRSLNASSLPKGYRLQEEKVLLKAQELLKPER